jgi:phosphoribosylanthranilate isomerase
MKPVFLKICCISSLEEAELAHSLGAHALGLVSEMPSGPGVISEELIAQIVSRVPPTCETFLLTCATDHGRLVAQQRRTQASVLQLVDDVPLSELQALRRELPTTKIVQVLHVQNETILQKAKEIQPYVDGILLDSGNPTAAIPTLGGTGNVHDWNVSKKVCKQATVPVFLAGGIRADNVEQAMEQVQPDGLDLCSSLRTEGHLDTQKVQAFVARLSLQSQRLFVNT